MFAQPETAPALCKYCGAAELPVERKGKVYFYWLPYNTTGTPLTDATLTGTMLR